MRLVVTTAIGSGRKAAAAAAGVTRRRGEDGLVGVCKTETGTDR
jgi:hypothetical protein